ncbi:MAG: hypothetical protein OIF50_12685 [Flavobacteriaceae bacterium]|nr:hypothetical protein [Flavobacteriaceae bacterium]
MGWNDRLKETWRAQGGPQMQAEDDAAFQNLLQQELHSKPRTRFMWYAMGAAAAVLVAVVVWWPRSNPELVNRMELALERNSNAETLAAVYHTKDKMKASDKELIGVFIEVLEQSDNANVKVVLIDALLQFPKDKNIRKALLETLRKEKEPLVQIKLIDAMLKLQEMRAKEPIQAIIAQEETYPVVKRNATMAINHLKQKQ